MAPRKPKAAEPVTAAGARRDLIRALTDVAHEHQLWRVWADFVVLAALALSNQVDLAQREGREARYLEIVGRYKPTQVARFPEALAALATSLHEEAADVLGSVFMELELGNRWKGQFFTPFSLCRLMAAMQMADGVADHIAAKGYITVNDPCVGGGAMPLAFAAELAASGHDPARHLHVTAQDVDVTAVHMAYVQLSLVGVPALVILGNSLAVEQREVWYTPAHVLGGWSQRLAGGWPLTDLPRLIEAALKLEQPANTTSEAAVVPGEDNPASAARASSRERPRPAEAQASGAGNVAEPPPRPGSQGRAEGPPPPPSPQPGLQIALPWAEPAAASAAPRARRRRAA
jgi:hypothetical protein